MADEKNPYPPGTAAHTRWRRENTRKAALAAEQDLAQRLQAPPPEAVRVVLAQSKTTGEWQVFSVEIVNPKGPNIRLRGHLDAPLLRVVAYDARVSGRKTKTEPGSR